MALIFSLGDVVETKKPHPCGGTRWEVVRTGADYKLRCITCGRVIMLAPDDLKRRVRRVFPKEE